MSTEGTAPVRFTGEGGTAPAQDCPTVEAYPVADFYEPVEFVWTEAAYEAHRALKKYSEATDPDYPEATC
jgi:hypothetical protein